MKILLIVLLLSAAQFPATIIVLWDPNPAADNVTSYSVEFNNSRIDVPLSNCSAVECSTKIIVPSSGTYTINLRAYNFWGSSEPTSLTFNASSPGKSGNLRIRVQ